MTRESCFTTIRDGGEVLYSPPTAKHHYLRQSRTTTSCHFILRTSSCRLSLAPVLNLVVKLSLDLVRQCIDADDDLECLRPFLVRHEDPAQDVIQVDGIRVAGVPLGSPEFVTRYVESKRDDILHDLPKLDVVSDDLVHAHMMTYCQHPRFGFL